MKDDAREAFEALVKSYGTTRCGVMNWHTSSEEVQAALTAVLVAFDAARAPISPAAQEGERDGFELMEVYGFEPLMNALDRAFRKGYMPDAMADEWEAFDFRAPIGRASSVGEPSATKPVAWQRRWIGSEQVGPWENIARVEAEAHRNPDYEVRRLCDVPLPEGAIR